MRAVALTVNGQAVRADIEPRTNLADFLRDHLTLTGTHTGCEHGVCGACTVLIDGAPARSCITFAAACDGADVTTIEGLDTDPVTAVLRQQFSAHHGLQCGYCTPGMLVTARDIVLRLPHANERRIREELAGNLCRCTGYVGIVKAIAAAIASRQADGEAAAARVLGPVGSGHPGAAQAADRAAGPERRQTAPARPVEAAVLSAEDWQAVEQQGTEINQSFTVAHPRTAVWDFFSDPEALARCMPGARLTAQPEAGTFEGEIVVKLGPIVATFAGVAAMERDEARYLGVVRGQGRDRRSASRARGIVRYELVEAAPDTTRVEVQIKFLLAGSLAQFSRTGLVNDVASQITAQFARNLEARLSGRTQPHETASPLNPVTLAWSTLWARFKAAFARLFGAR